MRLVNYFLIHLKYLKYLSRSGRYDKSLLVTVIVIPHGRRKKKKKIETLSIVIFMLRH